MATLIRFVYFAMQKHGEILHNPTSGNTLEAARKIFGADHIGSEGKIKKQYRRLASYFHPDRAPVEIHKKAEEIFKWVQAAYERLQKK